MVSVSTLIHHSDVTQGTRRYDAKLRTCLQAGVSRVAARCRNALHAI